MRAVIIGGGIGGVAAALALHQAGLGVTVYEAHPRLAAGSGAFLTLASNGMAALGQLDAARSASEFGFPLTELTILDETGAEVVTRPLPGSADPQTRYRCLRWVELCAALQSEARHREIRIQHGNRLESAAEDSTGVTVTFADGSTTRADLLIGADGLNSTLRPLIDPAVAPPRYAGQRVYYGYSFDADPSGGPARITMVRGHRTAFGYAVSPSGETYWFARVSADELPAARLAETSPGARREWLLSALRPDPTPAAEIVAATPDRIRVTNAYDLPDVPCWRTERMLLIGDAAHAASPATGQGASLAIEDAVVLAKALRDSRGIGPAFDLYERLRRPRVAHNVTASAQMSRGEQSPTGPRPLSDAELAHQLDWNSPLAMN